MQVLVDPSARRAMAGELSKKAGGGAADEVMAEAVVHAASEGGADDEGRAAGEGVSLQGKGPPLSLEGRGAANDVVMDGPDAASQPGRNQGTGQELAVGEAMEVDEARNEGNLMPKASDEEQLPEQQQREGRDEPREVDDKDVEATRDEANDTEGMGGGDRMPEATAGRWWHPSCLVTSALAQLPHQRGQAASTRSTEADQQQNTVRRAIPA